MISAEARSLNPYLADAVPGWFQAVLALYDEKGREVAFADDYRFDPDPVLLYEVPETGVYELEVRDAIYRGRQDFVYRVSVSEQPFVETVFPAWRRAMATGPSRPSAAGTSAAAASCSTPAPAPTRSARRMLQRSGMVSNAVSYAVDDLPEIDEREPNGPPSRALVDLPLIVNGRIAAAGDVDVFQFKGRRG